MTICSASSLADIRSKLCEITDLLSLAIGAADCTDPEWTAIRHAHRMADDLVGTVNELVPLSGAGNDAFAELKPTPAPTLPAGPLEPVGEPAAA